MNIFAYDDDPIQCALWLDDVRKNKMITETCQLLSTAMNILDPAHGYEVYNSFNPNHGSNVWTRQSSGNFDWLLTYVTALLDQRPLNKDDTPHSCTMLIRHVIPSWFCNAGCWKYAEKTMFSNNAANDSLGISFKHIRDPRAAYRLYSRARWQIDTIPLSWKYGQQPFWSGL